MQYSNVSLVHRGKQEKVEVVDNNKTDIYRLKRIDVPDNASLLELESKITAVFPFFKRLVSKKDFGFSS